MSTTYVVAKSGLLTLTLGPTRSPTTTWTCSRPVLTDEARRSTPATTVWGGEPPDERTQPPVKNWRPGTMTAHPVVRASSPHRPGMTRAATTPAESAATTYWAVPNPQP